MDMSFSGQANTKHLIQVHMHMFIGDAKMKVRQIHGIECMASLYDQFANS
jgi:hypothetical protein